ncbi:hypothetical protein B0H14DRAFT_2615199 [Mycena olivaceomarginata]|nr:hypothetical protein B0H14DRAFT_2615199 [Mycena olivaceomarginata]
METKYDLADGPLIDVVLKVLFHLVDPLIGDDPRLLLREKCGEISSPDCTNVVISLRGGLPGKENPKRIQWFTNQWGVYNKYPTPTAWLKMVFRWERKNGFCGHHNYLYHNELGKEL